MKKMFIIYFLSLVLVLLTACQSHETNARTTETNGTIIIGGNTDTDQRILVLLTSIYLQENHFYVEETSLLSNAAMQSAINKGQIDLYWQQARRSGDSVIPVVREEVYSDELKGLIEKLDLYLTIETLMMLSYQVDVEHKEMAEVSRAWLEEKALIQ